MNPRKLIFCLAFMGLCNPVFCQLTGTVKAAKDGSLLIGATIVIKGTTTGTISNSDGKFQVSTSLGDTLVISYLGFVTQELGVGNRTSLDIYLQLDTQRLKDVVVTGYTTQSLQDVTGSIAIVDVPSAKNIPSQSIEQMLQGQASGVYVSQEGAPGGNTLVRIRGFSTIGNNNPLYVIDGVPTKTGLNDINPNDVESIQVLKDAASASIYGSRAANGVIVITTTKGKPQKTSLSYNGYVGTQWVAASRYPDRLDVNETARFAFESSVNENGQFDHPQYGNSLEGPLLPDYLIPTGWTIAEDGDPPAYSDSLLVTRANPQGTDWLDELFQPAMITDHNLALSGGGKEAHFLFGLGYYNQQGVVRQTSFDRYSLRFNSEFSIGDWIRIGENATLSVSNNIGHRPFLNRYVYDAFVAEPILPIFDEGGHPTGAAVISGIAEDNPLRFFIANKDDRDRVFRALGNVFAAVDLLPKKNLEVKTTFGIDYRDSRLKQFSISLEENDDYRLVERHSVNASWVWTTQVHYQEKWRSGHVSILAGMEVIDNQFESFGASRTGFAISDPAFRYLNAGTENVLNEGFGWEWGLWSYFGKLDYSYQSKYLFSATIRRDGSSRFRDVNQWGTFPAVSVGWRLSDEPFLSSVSVLDDMKLRASWGQVGNQEIGPYPFACAFANDLRGTNYDLNGTNTSVYSGLAQVTQCNPNARWETTTTTDVGIELSAVEGQVNFSFDWYERTTDDMLVQVPQPDFRGQAQDPFLNVGEMKNTGVDMNVSFNGKAEGRFSYQLSANGSHYRNEVTSLGPNSEIFFNGGSSISSSWIPNRTLVGEPISSFFGYRADGIFRDEQEVEAHITQDGKAPGRLRYVDIDGDSAISAQDRAITGSPHPNFYWGVGMDFQYNLGEHGALKLQLQAYGVHGQQIFNNYRRYTAFRGNDRWSPDNPSGSVPMPNNGAPAIEAAPSTFYLEDGSFWRLRSVRMAWEFPASWQSAIGLSGECYVQGKNLLTITNYEGIEPEVNLRVANDPVSSLNQGVDDGVYPLPAVFLVGLNLNLQ